MELLQTFLDIEMSIFLTRQVFVSEKKKKKKNTIVDHDVERLNEEDRSTGRVSSPLVRKLLLNYVENERAQIRSATHRTELNISLGLLDAMLNMEHESRDDVLIPSSEVRSLITGKNCRR